MIREDSGYAKLNIVIHGEMYGFQGLGRTLNDSDIGKAVVRTYPIRRDWSCVPCKPDESQIRKSEHILKAITPTDFIIEAGGHTYSYKRVEYDDSHWLRSEHFIQFLKNDSRSPFSPNFREREFTVTRMAPRNYFHSMGISRNLVSDIDGNRFPN